MDLRRTLTLPALSCLLALASCGTPGNPVPPSLIVPRKANDFSAVRVADRVQVSFRVPAETLTRIPIKALGKVLLITCTDPEGQACQPVHTWQEGTVRPGSAVTFEADAPAQSAYYAVILQNTYGKSAGSSNLVFVPGGTAAQNASALRATLTAAGVELAPEPVNRRNDSDPTYRFTREEPGQKPVALGTADREHLPLVDNTFQAGKSYRYSVETLNHGSGPDGAPFDFASGAPATLEFTPKDTFAPVAPNGLVAVFSGKSIDLNWDPSSERDLKGYNVYRRQGSSEFVRINSAAVVAPYYQDASVRAGESYEYAVKAVDASGNESPLSKSATERVPEP